ncbi:MAG TPA: ABC transporter permease [Candidatus Polarisedimenticolia bacterium]|nr:ABC transporter permease [Candidatus Polarisedimenticolia bacterium]
MSSPSTYRQGAMVCSAGLLVAALAPLLANDRPLVARVEGKLCLPALASYGGPASIFRCRRAADIDWRRGRAEGGRQILLDPPIHHGPLSTDLESVFRPPSREHPMGTDSLGRDVAARLVHGFPVAVLVGGLATGLALVLGLAFGAAAGSGGRWADLGLCRVIDLVACFPTLILALALVAAVDRPGLGTLVGAIALTRWTGIARFFRGEVLRQRALAYCDAARAAGARRPYLLARHILPNALPPILVTAAFSASSAILLESGMSFLGLGVSPPTPSWGAILAEAQKQAQPAWWLILFPTLALFFTVLGCNLLAEGHRDATDPRIL